MRINLDEKSTNLPVKRWLNKYKILKIKTECLTQVRR